MFDPRPPFYFRTKFVLYTNFVTRNEGCDVVPVGQNPRMKKLAIALIALLLIVAIAIVVRMLGARDETDAVDAKDASSLVEQRTDARNNNDDDDTATDDDRARDDTRDPGLRPAPGTYTYRGSGREQVDVLGGSEHVFPDTIPVVIKLDETPQAGDSACGWTMNVIYVKQHVEERRYCTTKDAVVDRGFTRHIQFFGRTQEARYECGDDAARLRLDAKRGSRWSWECRDADADATSRYTLTYLGPVTITVDGRSVETHHARITSVQTGGTVGRDTAEAWLAPTGLPVRFSGDLSVRTKSVLGQTRFTEHFTYELTSLEPERP